MKILIVDDELHMRELVSAMLESPEHELFSAENGHAALTILRQEHVDVVITDLVMPEKNGIDLILEIRQLAPHAKIVAMSGGGGLNGRFDYLPLATLIGATNILRKPFRRDELCAALSALTA